MVFLILIIVQYVVVTNGAQRVAEVAARFTLDSMPGKQMSIDADLNMGIISQADAKFRRSQIEKEANFYGAMDGASKFVKGDAIAGILIVLVDLIGGFAIGMAQKGMSLTESIHTYSLLTVGDGLITQIPALTISMATGIIVTRAATDAHLGREVANQIAAYPKSLMMVCCCLFAMLFFKGIPLLPVIIILLVFITATILAHRNQVVELEQQDLASQDSLLDKIRVHPIEIQMNTTLYNELMVHEALVLQQVQQYREKLAYELGFIMPEVKICAENKLNYPFYQILIQGNPLDISPLHMDKLLAISSDKHLLNGIKVMHPSLGIPAEWITPEQEATGINIKKPLSVLMNHLLHVIEEHLPELLSRSQTEILLEQAGIHHLREELIPALLPLGHVQRILQHLLQEKVSIRSLSIILETLLEHAKQTNDPIALTELVRLRLSSPICQTLVNQQRQLPVITIEPILEQQLCAGINNNQLALEPNLTHRFIRALALQVESMMLEHKKPVLLCTSVLRRHIKQLTQRVMPQLTVLGMNEIPVNIQVESFRVVKE